MPLFPLHLNCLPLPPSHLCFMLWLQNCLHTQLHLDLPTPHQALTSSPQFCPHGRNKMLAYGVGPRLETLIVPVTPPTRVPLVNVVLLALLAPKVLLVKLVALVKLVCLVPR